MRYLLREIAGWVLVAIGLFVFYICLMLLLSQHVIEAGPLTVIGIFVFRGGIHLLKVAVAAQICSQDRTDVAVPVKAPPRRPGQVASPARRPA